MQLCYDFFLSYDYKKDRTLTSNFNDGSDTCNIRDYDLKNAFS